MVLPVHVLELTLVPFVRVLTWPQMVAQVAAVPPEKMVPPVGLRYGVV
jgi:hypothetical protein